MSAREVAVRKDLCESTSLKRIVSRVVPHSSSNVIYLRREETT